jgi:hypothetical protein
VERSPGVCFIGARSVLSLGLVFVGVGICTDEIGSTIHVTTVERSQGHFVVDLSS